MAAEHRSRETITQGARPSDVRLARTSPQRERPSTGPSLPAHNLIAMSTSMRNTVELACRVARVDSTLLVTGESGSGKERIARLVHDESPRASGPFIAVNCAAITETLLESELFGHARGAFSGATEDRAGLFEAAASGTLLLDEIGEVPRSMQVKLLRTLQEREVRRVGETKTRRIDARVIAATNRDLDRGVENGSFRKDLYYRLKVVNLVVPSLRDRADDILPLALQLQAEATVRLKRAMSGFATSVVGSMLRYAWPGNVRELSNTMERAVALARGTEVELEDLPEEVRREGVLRTALEVPTRRLADVEKDHILATLGRNGGNQRVTAAQLGIGVATLYRKLRNYRSIG